MSKTGTVWGEGITEKVIWCVVKDFASKAQLGNLAPHDQIDHSGPSLIIEKISPRNETIRAAS